MSQQKLTDFKVLTFDCYGTLIDWETGIIEALRPILKRQNQNLSDDEILTAFAKFETLQQQKTPSYIYPEILRHVFRSLVLFWELDATPEEENSFASSVKNWPVFEDSVVALSYLKKHFKLVILSNVDLASFAASNEKLAVLFDDVFTAEEIGSYKPDSYNFTYMLDKLKNKGIQVSEILHTAQSLYHDHVPAMKIGLTTCHIHRRFNKQEGGATPIVSAQIKPRFVFNSLQELVASHKTICQSDK